MKNMEKKRRLSGNAVTLLMTAVIAAVCAGMLYSGAASRQMSEHARIHDVLYRDGRLAEPRCGSARRAVARPRRLHVGGSVYRVPVLPCHGR